MKLINKTLFDEKETQKNDNIINPYLVHDPPGEKKQTGGLLKEISTLAGLFKKKK